MVVAPAVESISFDLQVATLSLICLNLVAVGLAYSLICSQTAAIRDLVRESLETTNARVFGRV